MTDAQLHRDIGNLQARVTVLEGQIKDMNAKLDVLLEAVTEAKGGFRLVLVVGTLGAALGGLLLKLWERIT
ncbi:hypothetical protein [Pseudoxanthomonas mexicana]|uniref:hypothetical protein n=1 Tax=Pseudoxanthomonas mexicana TaxID=128785 RepID=UPI0028AC555C|nr:hypothetical protein [Pseudoxanthomonas mexicana]